LMSRLMRGIAGLEEFDGVIYFVII